MSVINMDCVEGMRGFPDNSFDSIVTDPPYELGFMGKAWDSTGIANNVVMWREALRVLKPGGHLLAFSGSRTYHRMACAIEDAGFEVRDQIMWVYGSGFPKSHNLTGDFEGWGTALKPAHEPICVARKPLVGTVAANVLQFGTGAINIDGCRVDGPGGVKWETPRGGIWATDSAASAKLVDNPLGRWPANVIHDGSDEVFEAFAGKISAAMRANETPARFFYCAKASSKDRHEGLDNPGPQFEHGSTLRQIENTPTKGNHHPTVKPTDLMRYLVRLVTPPGGVVLDPFAGSGSTGKACALEGFGFIGFELSAEYAAIATARIKAAA